MTITQDTRRDGQQSILPFLDVIREKVYEAVKGRPGGLTAEEVDVITHVGLNNARSRCSEFFKEGRFVVRAKRLNAAGTRRISVYEVK
jgi:hypothetical protein